MGAGLSKALGPLAGGLEVAGEFAVAKTQGDSNARALGRGVAEAATSAVAWPAREFSKAGVNPLQPRAEYKAQQAQVNDFYDNLAKNIVNTVAPATPKGSAAVSPGAIAAGAGGLALTAGAFVLSKGKKGVATPAQVGKGVKAAQATYKAAKASKAVQKAQAQAAKVAANPRVQKAAQVGKGTAQAVEAAVPQSWAKGFHDNFTKKATNPGAILGVGLFAATAGTMVSAVAKPVAQALHIPGAGPAPPPRAPVPMGLVTGYTGQTRDNALYSNPQPAWWDQAFFGGRVNEAWGGPKGLEVVRQENQNLNEQRRQDLKLQQGKYEADLDLQGDQAKAGATQYSADQRLTGVKDTNRTRLAVSDYESGRRLQGTQYTADQRLAGTQYQSDTRLQGTQYTADQRLQGQVYTADSRLQGEQVKAGASVSVAGINATGRVQAATVTGQARVQAADMTSGRKLQGDMYTADQRLRGVDLDSGRKLQGVDLTSGRKLQGDMYTADQKLRGVDLESGRKLQGVDLESGRKLQGIDLESGRKLQGEQVRAGAEMFGASEDRKARKYAANAGVMQAMGAAAAGAKINSAVPDMMKRGYNPLAGGMENLYNMQQNQKREERQAQLGEARSNMGGNPGGGAFVAREAAKAKGYQSLDLEREKSRGKAAAANAKGYQDWLSKSLFGGQ
jgi:hypothetical protein